mgnify:CR=1 FL=1
MLDGILSKELSIEDSYMQLLGIKLVLADHPISQTKQIFDPLLDKSGNINGTQFRYKLQSPLYHDVLKLENIPISKFSNKGDIVSATLSKHYTPERKKNH